MKMNHIVPMISPLLKLKAAAATRKSTEFRFAWERENGCCYQYALPIPPGMESDVETIRLAERIVKFVLWSAGGWRLHLAGPEAFCAAIEKAYSQGGSRSFDREMMHKAYGRELEVCRCSAEAVPASRDSGKGAGISWKGCRIFWRRKKCPPCLKPLPSAVRENCEALG